MKFHATIYFLRNVVPVSVKFVNFLFLVSEHLTTVGQMNIRLSKVRQINFICQRNNVTPQGPQLTIRKLQWDYL